MLYFFFFQAEDGIRDLTVTGVQTCALPISSPTGSPASTGRPTPSVTWATPRPTRSARSRSSTSTARSEEHTSELQSQSNLVCRLLLEKKNIWASKLALTPDAAALRRPPQHDHHHSTT